MIEVKVPGPMVVASVSLEQVRSYLRRTGWNEGEQITRTWREWSRGEQSIDAPAADQFRDISWCLGLFVGELAKVERRPAYEVLRDIAAEVVGGR